MYAYKLGALPCQNVPDLAFDIVCCPLGQVWNRPLVLVLLYTCHVQSDSVKARCRFLLIFLAHFLIVSSKKKEIQNT